MRYHEYVKEKAKTKKESNKIPTEYEEQYLLFRWIRENEDNYPALKYANASLSGIRLPSV